MGQPGMWKPYSECFPDRYTFLREPGNHAQYLTTLTSVMERSGQNREVRVDPKSCVRYLKANVDSCCTFAVITLRLISLSAPFFPSPLALNSCHLII
jgi:hypothetical protein